MNVTYVSADDWSGVYVDGELRYENHDIPSEVWLDLLIEVGVEVLDLAESDEAYEAIGAFGRCPSTWPRA